MNLWSAWTHPDMKQKYPAEYPINIFINCTCILYMSIFIHPAVLQYEHLGCWPLTLLELGSLKFAQVLKSHLWKAATFSAAVFLIRFRRPQGPSLWQITDQKEGHRRWVSWRNSLQPGWAYSCALNIRELFKLHTHKRTVGECEYAYTYYYT